MEKRIDKRATRMRRARRGRMKMRELGIHRLCVHRTPRHIYAQIISPEGGTVLASASTLDPELRGTLEGKDKKDKAMAVGRLIAERSKAAGILRVAFDRSGFKYHGRVKALAEAARTQGLEF
ncbi:MAG: 50S ribosomal protein L18 [Gammaproteobacteria bacterium]|nr:MAG: 50S ribosomal protein L18 [Gammaproteobacteria bacterium]